MTEVPELAIWPDVELVAVGEWALSTGIANFTSADLAQACAAARCPAVGQPVLKLGHHDPRFDGEPAIGWIDAMRLNETQTKLLGDFTGMPGWLAAILPSAYPERSIEGCWDFTCQIGHVHPFVITAVALLGVTPPGVGTIGSLNDVAALYGIDPPAEPAPAEPAAGAARPRAFRILATPGETAMPPQTRPRPADAAGVVPTVDDIRREYYEDADWSEWIVEVQITADGLVLIVIDDTGGELKRVPVDLSEAGKIKFGEDVPVLVSYVDAPPSPEDLADDSETVPGGKVAMPPSAAFPPGRQVAASWGTRAASRRGVAAAAIASHSTATDTGSWDGPANEANLDNGDGAAEYRAAYAWIDPDADADTKAAYRFIHHMVSATGSVGAASTVACSTGIGVLNGGRGGTSIPDADVQGVYNHLAKHLTDSGATPPELAAAAPAAPAGMLPLEPDPDVQGAMRHGPYTGEHEHPHAGPAADGELHMHPHRHNNDGRHDKHGHDAPTEGSAAPAAPTQQGGADDMQLSEETIARVRAALGLADDVEVTDAHLADLAARAPANGGGEPAPAPSGVIDAATPELPVMSDGTYLVDSAIISDWRNRAMAGDAAVRELAVRERDTILGAAIFAGKFPQARLEHYQQMWDRDPDGTRRHVDTLAAGLVPMGGPAGKNPGYDPDLPGDFDSQAAYKALYGDEPAARR
jgi:hypothetical protein